MSASENESQTLLTKPLFQASDEQKALQIASPHVKNMPVITLNVTQRVIARPSVAIQNKKGISTCVDQSPHMPAITQQAYQHAKSNPLICQRRHKMYLNIC